MLRSARKLRLTIMLTSAAVLVACCLLATHSKGSTKKNFLEENDCILQYKEPAPDVSIDGKVRKDNKMKLVYKCKNIGDYAVIGE